MFSNVGQIYVIIQGPGETHVLSQTVFIELVLPQAA